MCVCVCGGGGSFNYEHPICVCIGTFDLVREPAQVVVAKRFEGVFLWRSVC